MLLNDRLMLSYLVGTDTGIPCYMGVSPDRSVHNKRMIIHHRIPANIRIARHECGAPDNSVFAQNRLLIYKCIIAGNGIVEDPAGSFLAEIFFTLDVSAQISFLDTGPHIA